MQKSGKCKKCGIVTWKDLNNKPKVFPCGVTACPYERVPVYIAADCSMFGNGQNQE